MTVPVTIGSCTGWVFDMDGTLTVAAHDFPAIKRDLGLPGDAGILEAMASLEPDRHVEVTKKLHEIEWEIASRAEAAEGALGLLSMLRNLGLRIGVVTRNRKETALRTLECAGLREFFAPQWVLGRDEAPHKPDPAGLRHLLGNWAILPKHAVMVGDHLHDLEAGRRAGTLRVYVDPSRRFPFENAADLRVGTLSEVSTLLAQTVGSAL